MTTSGHDRPMPCDALSLWMLTAPAHPVRVGVISLALNGQAVALRYDPQWSRRGYALSEDLPLVDDLFVPTRRQEAAGAVEDARPGRWGERVIRRFERSPRMSLLEFLPFAGPDRYRALGVSRRLDAYEACGAKATDLDVMAQYLDNDRLGAQRRAQAATGTP
jgi:serine/threonine-protein kinase HipA